MAAVGSKVGTQRVGALVLLLVLGIVSLPVSAAFLDGEGTENWILPVQLVGMAVVGAVVGRLLPGLAGADAPGARSAWIGALAGFAAALVGVGLFFLLLNGFSGA
jgi:hypothetical protein